MQSMATVVQVLAALDSSEMAAVRSAIAKLNAPRRTSNLIRNDLRGHAGMTLEVTPTIKGKKEGNKERYHSA